MVFNVYACLSGFLCDAETEMGNSCFDCSTLNVNATCSKREICEMNNTSNNINCYCAAGFKGDYCQKSNPFLTHLSE